MKDLKSNSQHIAHNYDLYFSILMFSHNPPFTYLNIFYFHEMKLYINIETAVKTHEAARGHVEQDKDDLTFKMTGDLRRLEAGM